MIDEAIIYWSEQHSIMRTRVYRDPDTDDVCMCNEVWNDHVWIVENCNYATFPEKRLEDILAAIRQVAGK